MKLYKKFAFLFIATCALVGASPSVAIAVNQLDMQVNMATSTDPSNENMNMMNCDMDNMSCENSCDCNVNLCSNISSLAILNDVIASLVNSHNTVYPVAYRVLSSINHALQHPPQV
jgi:hypothetical protein